MDTITEKDNVLTVKFTFETNKRLAYEENGLKFVMGASKTEKGKIYYGCINRFRSDKSGAKCGATGVYDIESQSYTPKRSHLASCGVQQPNFSISESYSSQKEFLHQELLKNPRLTVAPAQELLTKENLTKSPSKRTKTLCYDQIKYIIDCYRKDNGINYDGSSSKEIIILTRDNALFLRYNSSFTSLNKGKVISNFNFI